MNQYNECKHYLKDKILPTTSDCSLNEYILCEQIPDCYYKQLQKLKQENEELKILIESNRQQVEHSGMLIYDNDYLQQKLEKINEIAKENCSCTRCEDFNCCDGCQDENYRRILQIIEGKEI